MRISLTLSLKVTRARDELDPEPVEADTDATVETSRPYWPIGFRPSGVEAKETSTSEVRQPAVRLADGRYP